MSSIAIDAELARATLAQAGTVQVRVTGGSMGPWIRSGDVVELEPALPGGVRRGEVLVFERNGKLIAHRAVRRTTSGWITRGDALDAPDALVSDAAVVGRVIGLHLRWLTIARPNRRLRSLAGRVLLHTSPWWVRALKLLPR